MFFFVFRLRVQASCFGLDAVGTVLVVFTAKIELLFLRELYFVARTRRNDNEQITPG